MASYKFYKQDLKSWSKKISGDENKEDYWKLIFLDHPEFFRFNSSEDQISLVWRRSKQRIYHVDLDKELTRLEVNALPLDEKENGVSRVLLSSSDISMLINTAINLHNRALENKKAKQWWLIPAIGIGGSLLGVEVGIVLKWWLD